MASGASVPPRDPPQVVRFCTTPDGVRLAYATVGQGPTVVKAPNWLSHLEYDWKSPFWRHLARELSQERTLVRFDQRGNGLSDWRVDDISFEAFVRDTELLEDERRNRAAQHIAVVACWQHLEREQVQERLTALTRPRD